LLFSQAALRHEERHDVVHKIEPVIAGLVPGDLA
jgi:hypothetical protein